MTLSERREAILELMKKGHSLGEIVKKTGLPRSKVVRTYYKHREEFGIPFKRSDINLVDDLLKEGTKSTKEIQEITGCHQTTISKRRKVLGIKPTSKIGTKGVWTNEEVRTMVMSGKYTAKEIADKFGYKDDFVRKLARKHKVKLPRSDYRTRGRRSAYISESKKEKINLLLCEGLNAEKIAFLLNCEETIVEKLSQEQDLNK